MKTLGLTIALAVSTFASGALSATPMTRPVAVYGDTYPTVGAAQRPDPKLRYRVVFNVTKQGPDTGKINASLDRVARFLNLLAADGVRVRAGDIVAVVYGAATPIVLTDKAYAAQTTALHNPNLDLIVKLKAAGVIVALCSQSMQAHNFTRHDVSPDVRVDVSALTTMTTLQMRGWVLNQD